MPDPKMTRGPWVDLGHGHLARLRWLDGRVHAVDVKAGTAEEPDTVQNVVTMRVRGDFTGGPPPPPMAVLHKPGT